MPLATSTANGSVAAIAAATLSGFRPPLRMIGAVNLWRRTSSQSTVWPVPPGTPSTCASSRWKSVWNAAAACSVAFERTRDALMTFAPVRRATSRQKIGPSSPCSWTIVRPTA